MSARPCHFFGTPQKCVLEMNALGRILRNLQLFLEKKVFHE
jgi:hypothetical protein